MTYKVIIFSTLISSITHCALSQSNWVLKWSDDFTTDELNTNYWKQLYYVYQYGCFINNTQVLSENLILTANTVQDSVAKYASCKIQSSMITTKFGWTYGKFEINASVENNNAVAFINLSPVNNTYGKLNDRSGSIDILRHNNQFLKSKTEYTSVGIRYGDNFFEFNYLDWHLLSQLYTGFHVFTLEWHRNQMIWKVDDSTVYYLNMDRFFRKSSENARYANIGQPFDHAFRLILANQFYSDIDCDSIDGNFTGSEFVVDYVKYYEWTENRILSKNETSNNKPNDQVLQNAMILFSAILVLFIVGSILLYYNIRKIKKKVETISAKGDDIYDDIEAKAEAENEYFEINLYDKYETLRYHTRSNELEDDIYLQINS